MLDKLSFLLFLAATDLLEVCFWGTGKLNVLVGALLDHARGVGLELLVTLGEHGQPSLGVARPWLLLPVFVEALKEGLRDGFALLLPVHAREKGRQALLLAGTRRGANLDLSRPARADLLLSLLLLAQTFCRENRPPGWS